MRSGHAALADPTIPADDDALTDMVMIALSDGVPSSTMEWEIRRRQLLEGQNAALELIVNGTDLTQTLCHLCGLVEELAPSALCSILLLQDGRLRLGAAPSLPTAFNRLVDGTAIGPASGSCGTAAFCRQPVVAGDIATDPLWDGHRAAALEHGLAACWSYPIIGQNSQVLGTFAIYHRAPCEPKPEDWQLIKDISRLVRIALERDEKDRALQEKTGQIRNLAANIPGAVYQRLVRPDGSMRYIYISDGCQEIFGLTAAEIMADPLKMLNRLDEPQRQRFVDDVRAASANLSLWDAEMPVTTVDGRRRWTHALARPQRLADGSVLWDGIVLDVTRRKLAEMSAEGAQARLQDAIESLPEGFALFDGADRLVTFNQPYAEMFAGIADVLVPGVGFPEIAQTAFERQTMLIPADQRATWFEQRLRRRIAPGESVEIELPDGRHMLVNERRTSDGGLVAIYNDISGLKRQEAEIRQQTNLLQQTLENLDIGVSVYDRDLRLVAMNQRFCALMGYPPEFDKVGTPLESFFRYSAEHGEYGPGEVAAQVTEQMQLARQFTPNVMERRRGNGAIVEVRNSPMPSGGVVTSYTDITERHQARFALKHSEESLRDRVMELEDSRGRLERQGRELVDLAESLARARDEAEAASRTKSEFLANMSHELRTPLNAVIGFSEIMMGELFGPLGDGRYRDYAKDVHDSGNHLLDLINDILDLSKVEAGRLELHESAVDVSRVIQTCHRLVRERAVNADIALRVEDSPSPLPPIMADEIKLKQIVLNLLSNAVKFTPRGGKVTIRAERDAAHDLCLRVIDTGIGIAPDDIPIALQPFRQIDSALSRKHAGTGLGLPLTKALVEMHGGNLEIVSTPGIGTIVTVHLPAQRFLPL